MEELTKKISGRRILVTGGTTGIGREIALQLAVLGGRVLIAGQEQQHLEDTLATWNQMNGKGQLHGIASDLSTNEGIRQLFAEADRIFEGKLDIMVNNAALAYGSVMEGGYPDWQRVVNTNLLGYIACSRMALDRMKNKSGHIVLIGSMSADVREPQSSVYVATKAGIQGFAESLRKEVNESGVRITLIEPGAVDTDMQPQTTDEKQQAVDKQEMMTAEDIAAAVCYALAQDERCDVVEIRLRPRLQLI
ncbi:SDR family oxidoreductase [Mucilaginibacter sp. RCC_168]|jgi:NAD(P)-dependent dehydrogenase (short-subunit alcohol dehydrogenase family)|uniref:SDR family oxidoreductase n=1 Tax=Mucilaginibacter sp. RCC_168 TaxID=3239221 RepID=UPI0035263C33